MRRLISFIRFESLEVSLLITYTTAILSEWSTIDVFVSNKPQISTARIIGKNSRTEMWYSSQLVSKEPKNHLVPNTQPKPTLLASVNKCRVFEVNESRWEKGFAIKMFNKKGPGGQISTSILIKVAVMMRFLDASGKVNDSS